MRLEQLEIDAFGHFSNTALGPFDGRMLVIHGPNEAGKTTLLAFIRGMLYGFPPDDHADQLPTWMGGAPGGKIALRDDDLERCYLIERHGDVCEGQAQLTLPDGTMADDEALRRLLGELPGELYRRVFTLTIDELQRLAELAPDGLNDGLFDAALGLDQLRARERAARKRTHAIFAPPHGDGELRRLLVELDESERASAANRADYEEYSQLLEELATRMMRLAELGEELDAARRNQVALALVRNAWNDWIAFQAAERRLAKLAPVTALPEETSARLDQLEDELHAAERDVTLRHGTLEELAQRSAAITVPDAALLDCATHIEGLRAARPRIESWLRELPQRRADLDKLTSEVEEMLAELGPEWGTERLAAFDPEHGQREELHRQRRRLAELHADLRVQQANESSAEQVWREAERTHAILTSQIDELSSNTPEESVLATRLPLVRRARERWMRLELARRNLADEQRRLTTLEELEEAGDAQPTAPATTGTARRPWIPLTLVATGLVLAALGWLLGDSALALGLAAAGILAIMALVSWFVTPTSQPETEEAHPFSGAASTQRQRLQRAQNDVEEALTAYGELALALDVAPDESGADLERIERNLDGARGRLRAMEQLRAQLREAELAAGSGRQRLHDIRARRETLAEELGAAEAEWRAWLHTADLPEDMTPDSCATLLRRIEHIHEQFRAIESNRTGLRELVLEARRYQALLTTALASVGEPAPGLSVQAMASMADQIIARYDQAHATQSTQQRLSEQAEAERLLLHEREREAQVLRAELAALLVAMDADSPTTARKLAREGSELRELRANRDAALERLQRLSGPGAAWTALRKRLKDARYDALSAEGEALDARIVELEAERGELLGRRGELDERLRQIERRALQDDLPQRRALLRAQLRDRVDEWLVTSTAATALAEARRRFAIERQPAIVARARVHFSTLTAGAYETLADVRGPDDWIEVVDAHGRRKRVHELSRGTREQLFMAFRLALIEDFAARLGRLPVLLDDVLVNFDPARADAAIRCLAALSQRCQVVFFTCHPATVERFAAAEAPVQIIDLDTDKAALLPVPIG